ncbi:MAG TPA: arginine repressor [Candidatus Fimenecus excrementigallinarum]|uniref:Arginine repressor n=1 Tax=Candidatus Fimenecus excrementigallinarum TaxID=2840816 RepID=A0A9D1IGZ9_9FIRM|nr:arginine repressor [Candidatus Fimenecus excrementigallinarum]
MKKKRHALILQLVQNHAVATQDELLQLLRENGFDVTQATVSRDIKELGLIKAPSKDGPAKYALTVSKPEEDFRKFYEIFSHSVLSIDNAGHLCAVKCYAGTGNAAGAAIDAMKLPDVVGTLAGDDTVFVLCRTPEDAERLQARIYAMLNGETDAQ